MALPNTGSTITMSQISNYFSGPSSTIRLSADLGPYIGISNQSLIRMSESFGGYYFP
tara:strand:+ start:697 stop:867 length:171 start_codon:yes stop_codon:yes gene_type:complete